MHELQGAERLALAGKELCRFRGVPVLCKHHVRCPVEHLHCHGALRTSHWVKGLSAGVWKRQAHHRTGNGKEAGEALVVTPLCSHDPLQDQATLLGTSAKHCLPSILFLVQLFILQTNCHEGLIEVLLIDNPGPVVRNSCILQVFMTHILHESHALGFFINWENQVNENGAEVLIGFERIFAQDVQLDVHLVDSPVTLSRQFAWVNLCQDRVRTIKGALLAGSAKLFGLLCSPMLAVTIGLHKLEAATVEHGIKAMRLVQVVFHTINSLPIHLLASHIVSASDELRCRIRLVCEVVCLHGRSSRCQHQECHGRHFDLFQLLQLLQ
mmetsp:Transcript_7168/g.16273  ORF Transcript_7168/g.16273 Transcript_7168/m.16273 type:complete len:325 (+) Transcript_7168:930-1904(+)